MYITECILTKRLIDTWFSCEKCFWYFQLLRFHYDLSMTISQFGTEFTHIAIRLTFSSILRNDLSRSLLTCILILYRVIWYLSYIDILVYTWWIAMLYIFMLNKFCLSPESWVLSLSMYKSSASRKVQITFLQNVYIVRFSGKLRYCD